MVVFIFSILDQDNRIKFFKKSFLLANIKLDVIFEILFVTISRVDVNFQA